MGKKDTQADIDKALAEFKANGGIVRKLKEEVVLYGSGKTQYRLSPNNRSGLNTKGIQKAAYNADYQMREENHHLEL